jgi:hypothetical protein
MRAARIALVIAVALSIAAPADAAVTIGSTLAAPPDLAPDCAETCTVTQDVAAGVGGVITRWRVRIGATTTPAPMRLQVLGAQVTASALVTPDPNTTSVFATRLTIAPGDAIGVACCADDAPIVHAALAPSWKLYQPVLPSGAMPTSFTGEVLVNADVEPDADADGFGDETQDTCTRIPQDVQSDRDHDGFGDVCDTCPDVAGAGPRGCPILASPPAPPNKPPTARFRTPLSGRGVGPTVRIELDAADDHGLPVVSVFDDDGTICVLRAAPYACTWRPTGADVGRATLLASAVDSAGLSSLAIVRVRVNRFAAKLTKKAKRTGGRLRVTGRLVLPATVTRAQGCRSGKVTVRVRTARRTVPLTPRCTYSVRLKARTGRPRVRFGGNPVIAPT